MRIGKGFCQNSRSISSTSFVCETMNPCNYLLLIIYVYIFLSFSLSGKMFSDGNLVKRRNHIHHFLLLNHLVRLVIASRLWHIFIFERILLVFIASILVTLSFPSFIQNILYLTYLNFLCSLVFIFVSVYYICFINFSSKMIKS